jgi:hypothetical protein
VAGVLGRDPSRSHLRALRLSASAGMPVRSRLPLAAFQRRGSLRQGYPPQAHLLRLSGAYEGLLARAHHPLFDSLGQRPRALGTPRTRRVYLGPSPRRSQLPLAEDQRRAGADERRASSGPLRPLTPPNYEIPLLKGVLCLAVSSLPDRHRLFAARGTLLHKAGVGA